MLFVKSNLITFPVSGFCFFSEKNRDIEIKHPSRGLRSPKIASVLHAFLFLFSLSVVIEMQKTLLPQG